MAIRILFVMILTSIFSFASIVNFEELDPKKSIIQIGTYSKTSTVKRIQKALIKKSDIYIRKEQKYTVLYVVNIPTNDRKKVLRQIQKKYKDAFIQKKAYKVIKKHSQKNPKKKPTPLKLKEKKVTTALKPKIITPPKKKETLPVQKEKPKKKVKKVKPIKQDSNTVAIQIGTYSKQKTVERVKKELENKRDIHIKKSNKYTIIYVINIPKNERHKVLKELRKKYKGAFISKKVYKAKSKTKVIDRKTQLTHPEQVQLFYSLSKKGLQFFKQRNYQESYNHFKQAFIISMTNLEVDFYLGRSAYELGKYQEALDIYKYIVYKDPENKQVQLELAQTYHKLENYEQSKKHFIESYK